MAPTYWWFPPPFYWKHPTAFAVTPLNGSSALSIFPLCLCFRIAHCPRRDNRTFSSRILEILEQINHLMKKKIVKFDERTNVNIRIQ